MVSPAITFQSSQIFLNLRQDTDALHLLNINFNVGDIVGMTQLHEASKNGQVKVVFQENDTFLVIFNHCEDPLEIHLLFTICIL